jgi:hypothetical protein
MTEMIDRARLSVVEVIQNSDLPAGTYIDSEKIVRAVIKAMREPTPDMMRSGLEALAKAGCGSPIPGWASENCLRAMLDAALGDTRLP